ncbi:zinc finger protein 845-like [Mytilus californianus]|uniref:zinc finger protein 845-like n=1 Tax=Mytilus californianus TaxID=6549 RepID=UPI002247BB8A|nr:zinc finger protein 845-like [Mytilus californianus]
MGDDNIRTKLSKRKRTKLNEIWTKQNLTLSGSNTGQESDEIKTGINLTLYKRKMSSPAGTKKVKMSAVESKDQLAENGLEKELNSAGTDSLTTRQSKSDSGLTNFESPPNIVVIKHVKRDIEDSHDSSEKQLQKSCGSSNLNMLQCALCTLSFDNPSVYIQHVVSHSNTSIDFKQNPDGVNKRKSFFVCRLCDKKFANREFAHGHISHFLQNPDPVHEQFSNFLAEDKKELEEFADKFIFPVSIGSLKNITMDTKINKPVIYYCAKCETNFNSKCDLLGHVKNCIKNKSEFNCSKCDIHFETNDLLEQHIHEGHRESWTSHIPELVIIKTQDISPDEKNSTTYNMYKCPKCSEVCNSLQKLMQHRDSKHNKIVEIPDTDYVCAHCLSTFPSQALLYKHIQIHNSKLSGNPMKEKSKTSKYFDKIIFQESNGKWGCKICQKSFSTRCNVVRHMTLHDDEEKKDQTCPFCQRVFHFKRYLQHHIMYMHGPKKQKIYKCDSCKTQFTVLKCFRRHQKKRSCQERGDNNSVVLKCQFCERTFEKKQSLERHIRTHTGEKPFKCEHCPYFSAYYANLKLHKKRRHCERPKKKGRPFKWMQLSGGESH